MAKNNLAVIASKINRIPNKVDMARAYNFIVYFDNKKMSFMKVSSIERGVELESFHGGGMNAYPYKIGKADTSEHSMIFERGLAQKDNPLRVIEPGQYLKKEISIFVTDENRNIKKAYYLTGAVVKTVTLGEFDASRSELVIERIEVLYDDILMEDIMF